MDSAPKRQLKTVVLSFVKSRFHNPAGAVLIVVGVDIGSGITEPEILRSQRHRSTAPVADAVRTMEGGNTAVDLHPLAGSGEFRRRRVDLNCPGQTVTTPAHRRNPGDDT